MKKRVYLLSLLLLSCLIILNSAGCQPAQTSSDTQPNSNLCLIKPVDISATNISGFTFPEPSDTIIKWVNTYDTAAIAKHAWGLWAALTAPTDQVCGTDTLRVFETWFGPKELKFMMCQGIESSHDQLKSGRTNLQVPRQFAHAAQFAPNSEASPIHSGSLYEAMGYSPRASSYAMLNKIFLQSSLSMYQEAAGPNSHGTVPSFPRGAMISKPVYMIFKEKKDGFYEFPVWPDGPIPDTRINYPVQDFWQVVLIDPENRQPEGKKVTGISFRAVNSGDSLEFAKVNLNDFFHFTLNQKLATHINNQGSANKATIHAGDLAIFCGGHFAAKEINNWTWQTYFWTPDPENPPFPSSAFIAQYRDSVGHLSETAKHYAAVTVYNMVWPNQPVTGGTNDPNEVKPMIGYGPYLEPSLSKLGYKSALNSNYKWGVQSNCMSCHALAAIDGDSLPLQNPYTADQYIDMNDPVFYNKVQTDFAWSIAFSAIKDSDCKTVPK